MNETGAQAELPVYWQLRFSHFNEKGRWALDYKGVRHVRRSLAPGTHSRRSKKLGGSGTTPLLQIGGQTIGDTTEMIAELERIQPDPPLYPTGEAERERALELEEYFDVELGPYIRGAVFDALIPDREALISVTTQGLGAGTRRTLSLLYPLIRGRLRKVLVDAPGGPEVCREKTLAALDRLEAEIDGGEYLAGDRFSVADLTAAALFFPLVSPPEFQYERPDPWPGKWEEFRESVADRTGYRWVGEIFRRHRGESAEVAG